MAISLRKHAWEIFHAGLRAVEPDVCIKTHRHLKVFFGKIKHEGKFFLFLHELLSLMSYHLANVFTLTFFNE